MIPLPKYTDSEFDVFADYQTGDLKIVHKETRVSVRISLEAQEAAHFGESMFDDVDSLVEEAKRFLRDRAKIQ